MTQYHIPDFVRKLAQAHHDASAKDMLLMVVAERGAGKIRYVVKNMVQDGKIIKRMRPSQTGMDVLRWMDEQHPDGVYYRTVHSNLRLLRFQRNSFYQSNVDQALTRLKKYEDSQAELKTGDADTPAPSATRPG